MKVRKYSQQRNVILGNLSTCLDHPTTDMTYRDLRKEYPHISLGTVYRSPNLLTGLGRTRGIYCGGGTEHYNFGTSDHCHFIYKHCGNVVDLPLRIDYILNAFAK